MATTFDAPASLPRFGVVSFAKRIIAGLQLSRMRSVLNQMSDAQLAQIGIARDEIDARAAELVAR